MSEDNNLPQIEIDDFARRFSLRSANLMWLLGAGASASSGVPTAEDMVWEFKQQLFISQRRSSPHSVMDLSSPVIRSQLQAHIDSSGRLPPAGAIDEYAALFEAVYPAETDRRAYLDSKITGAKPSYGHLALATLMQAQRTRLVWTTNFDPLIADACAKVYGGTGNLTTVSLDAPMLASQSISAGRWPIEIKLHGDFRSRRLRNTNDELRQQDELLRQNLVNSCRRFGLVVVGYSGRDDSVLDALEEVVEHQDAYPAGLFWLHRGQGVPLQRVARLLVRAKQAGVEAALVRIQNCDEIMRDIIRLMNDIDTTVLGNFAMERRRWSPAPTPTGKCGLPVVRLNALPITQLPTVCRRITCQIGGYSEVRAAVNEAGVGVLAARTRVGVIAFGSDSDIRVTFARYSIADLDLHTIDVKRLRYESGERGLLRSALSLAFKKCYRLDVVQRNSVDLLAPAEPAASVWNPLRSIVGTIQGTVNGFPELHWREGIGIRLDWADDRLWLLIEPRTVFDGLTDENRCAAADFARERVVKRYNKQLNQLIVFWAETLANNGQELRALGIGDGVDAVFRFSNILGYSRRVGA